MWHHKLSSVKASIFSLNEALNVGLVNVVHLWLGGPKYGIWFCSFWDKNVRYGVNKALISRIADGNVGTWLRVTLWINDKVTSIISILCYPLTAPQHRHNAEAADCIHCLHIYINIKVILSCPHPRQRAGAVSRHSTFVTFFNSIK